MDLLTETNKYLADSNTVAETRKDELTSFMTAQLREEIEIIEISDSFCPIEATKNRKIYAEDIERATTAGFSDPTILQTLLCMNNRSVTTPRSAGVYNNFKVRNFITSLNSLGASGSLNLALAPEIEQRDPTLDLVQRAYIIKVPSGKDEADEQIHEYFVGAFGTNSLRDYIPNFSYVLGLFKCSPPYVDSFTTGDGTSLSKAITYCQNNDPNNLVDYIIYENVGAPSSVPGQASSPTSSKEGAPSLEDFIRTATFNQFLNVFVQIILALQVAYEKIDFTHGDLHDNNILIKRLPSPIAIPYEIGTGESKRTYYVVTDTVAMIIDYGRSHIKYNSQMYYPYKPRDYGYNGVNIGIYPNRSYPIMDIFKILCFSLLSALTPSVATFAMNKKSIAGKTDDQIFAERLANNTEVYAKGKEMLQYFGQDQKIASFLLLMFDNRYTFPYTQEWNVAPIVFFDSVLVPLYTNEMSKFVSGGLAGELVSLPLNVPLYGCRRNGVCSTFDRAVRDYTRSEIDNIETPFAYYEAFFDLQNSEIGAPRDKLVDLFKKGMENYQKYQEALISDYNNLYKLLELNMGVRKLPGSVPELKNFMIYSLIDIDPTIRYTSVVLREYHNFVIIAVTCIEIATSMYMIEKVFHNFNQMFAEEVRDQNPKSLKVNKYMEFEEINFAEKNVYIIQLNRASESLKTDLHHLNKLKEAERNKIMRENPDAKFLFEKLPWIQKSIDLL
ncbi:MAG: protein kinase [Solivirus sp.]|uniref:Protein kinase n=1 Tax=Solivirus sp. TaxID=2487772 RepID=A0A3G5AHQ0_9VIRU|nr:MAG: protein kinase [Solivirus sp.]